MNKNKAIKKGKFFLLIYFTNIATLIITIIVLSIILLVNFESIGLKITNNYLGIIQKQISYTSNYLRQYAINAGLQMFIDSDIIPLIYNDSPDYLQISQGMRRLTSCKIAASFIDSIHIYNSRADQFYSTNNKGLKFNNEFYDNEAKQLISEEAERPGNNLIARKIYEPTQKKYVNTFSLIIMSEKASPEKPVPSAIIINIKESWLRSMINDVSQESYNYTMITDSSGNVVSHPYLDAMFLENISGSEYFQKIQSLDLSSGCFTLEIDHTNYMISFSTSNVLNWKFINIIPLSEVTEEIQSMRSTLLMICIIIIALSLIIAFFLSSRIYKPLNNVVSNIAKLSPFKEYNHSVKDELQFLSNEYSMMANEVDHLNTWHREVKKIVKNDHLKNLISSNSVPDIDNTMKKLSEFNLSIDLSDDLKLITFIIDNYQSFIKVHQSDGASLLRYALGNIASEILNENGLSCEAVDFDQEHVILIIQIGDQDENKLDHALTGIIRNIQEASYKYLNLSVSAIVSRTMNSISGLKTLFEETMDISIYKIKYGYQCILTPNTLKHVQSENIIFPVDKEKSLIDAIRLGSIGTAKEIYLKIVEQFIDYPGNIIRLWIQRLAFTIYSTYTILENSNTVDFIAFIRNLNKLETIEDINAAFMSLFDNISESLSSKKNSKHQNLISEIKNRISHNYSDPSLSVTSIADMFAMSPVYLSKVFKDHTLETIADYITRVRLEESRKLLEKNECNINEISERVGFLNTKYFSTFFKKNLGVTPSEYQRNFIAEKSKLNNSFSDSIV